MRGDGRVFQWKNGTWGIAYYVNGEEVRESAAKVLAKQPRHVAEKDARRALDRRLAQIDAGSFVGPREGRLRMSEVLDGYLASCQTRGKKSLGSIRSHITFLHSMFGAERARALTGLRLEQWAAALLEAGRPPGTVEVFLAYLRAAMRWAQKKGLLAHVPAFPAITVNNARAGFFEHGEVERLLPRFEADAADVVVFGYLTGWREGEILPLAWTAVDRRGGVIRLGDSKTGEGRLIPLRRPDGSRNELGELIERRWAKRALGCPAVFHRGGRPIVKQTFQRTWRKATKAAGLEGKLFHDLRRTAARDLIAAGNDYGTAMSITGHKTMAVFRRYQIVDARLMQQGLDRLAAYRHAAPSRVVPLQGHGENTEKTVVNGTQVPRKTAR